MVTLMSQVPFLVMQNELIYWLCSPASSIIAYGVFAVVLYIEPTATSGSE
jgi:hypothetical protein